MLVNLSGNFFLKKIKKFLFFCLKFIVLRIFQLLGEKGLISGLKTRLKSAQSLCMIKNNTFLS